MQIPDQAAENTLVMGVNSWEDKRAMEIKPYVGKVVVPTKDKAERGMRAQLLEGHRAGVGSKNMGISSVLVGFATTFENPHKIFDNSSRRKAQMY